MTYYQYPNGEVHDLGFTPGMGSTAAKLSNADGKRLRAEYCRRELKRMIKPGATVYTILRHVSASGMQRRIDLCIVRKGKPQIISYLAADLMDDRVHDQGGIVVPGCGMDMGFHLVYSLGSRMWPQGTRSAHGRRNGEPDHSGGYALNHSWL